MKYREFVRRRAAYWLIAMMASLLLFVITITSHTGAVHSEAIRESAREVYRVVNAIRNESRGLVDTGRGVARVEPTTLHRLQVALKSTAIIFANNAVLNTLYVVPFSGAVTYVNSLVCTSLVSKYIGMQLRDQWLPAVLSATLTSPHTYLELLAYSITVVESTYIGAIYVKSAVKNRWTIDERSLIYSLLSIGLSYAILLLAAVVETLYIVHW